MLKPLSIVIVVSLAIAAVPQQPHSAALLDHARELLKQTPLIDGHNDYPWALREKAHRSFEKLDIAKPQPTIMTDVPRLRAGGVGGQFWSVYVPVELEGQTAVTATLEEIDTVHQMVRRYPETFELALTADDIERIFRGASHPSSEWKEGIRSTTRWRRCACSIDWAPGT
jgi:membrane dipeptidase